MNRWQGLANPEYFHGREIVAGNVQDVWARSDFGLPAQAGSVELVVYLEDGAVDVLDFTGKKAGFAEAGVSHWRVFMDASERGLIGLKGLGGRNVIDKLECIGWY